MVFAYKLKELLIGNPTPVALPTRCPVRWCFDHWLFQLVDDVSAYQLTCAYLFWPPVPIPSLRTL